MTKVIGHNRKLHLTNWRIIMHAALSPLPTLYYTLTPSYCPPCHLSTHLILAGFSFPTDRRFIQQPIAAPPVSKVTTNKSSYSYSTKDIQHSDSDNYRVNSYSITKDSASSNITKVNNDSHSEIQVPSSPSRSRNATRELICECGRYLLM